jgi:hypothetical protein
MMAAKTSSLLFIFLSKKIKVVENILWLGVVIGESEKVAWSASCGVVGYSFNQTERS